MNSNGSYVVSDKKRYNATIEETKRNGRFNNPMYQNQIKNLEVRYYRVTPVKDKNNYNRYLRVTNATGRTPYPGDREFEGDANYLVGYERVPSVGGKRRTHKRSKKARKSRKARHHH